MIDKIYYAAVLTCLTGLIIWAIKNFVGKALENMAIEVGHVKSGMQDVKAEVKSNLHEARKAVSGSTSELKRHFDKTCSERQAACSSMMDTRLTRMETHGHVGLKGDDSKITQG